MTPSGRISSKINSATKDLNDKYKEAAKKLQQSTPDADQAVDYIKQLCYSYVGWIPGGRSYVDTAFKDYYTVREKHQDEINEIVNDAYKQFQDVTKSDLSLASATKVYEILADVSQKIAGLAGDAIGDILDNHPKLKEQVGGSVDQLKQMGENYGPDAKKKVDETWKQAKEIAAGGFSAANIDKLRKLIEEKVEDLKKFGDEAWKKALEQGKPYLDKNPKVKKLIEENADALKQGNVKGLFEQAKGAVDSDKFEDFEKYVKESVDKAKSKGSSFAGGKFDQLFEMIPQGKEIIPKLQHLSEVAKSHSEDGEKLFKETMSELKKLLDDKSKKAQKIVDDAKKDAK